MASHARTHEIVRGRGYVRHRLARDPESGDLIFYLDWIDAPRGEGSALLEYVEQMAQRFHAKRIRLATHVERDEAADVVLRRFNFFQKHNYRFIGLEHIDMPSSGPSVRFMREKVLPTENTDDATEAKTEENE